MAIHSICSAVSTDNPCLLLLRSKNYALRIICNESSDGQISCHYIAEKGDWRFAGNSGPELLGLVILGETYGENWNQQEPDIMPEIIVHTTDESIGDAFRFK